MLLLPPPLKFILTIMRRGYLNLLPYSRLSCDDTFDKYAISDSWDLAIGRVATFHVNPKSEPPTGCVRSGATLMMTNVVITRRSICSRIFILQRNTKSVRFVHLLARSESFCRVMLNTAGSYARRCTV